MVRIKFLRNSIHQECSKSQDLKGLWNTYIKEGIHRHLIIISIQQFGNRIKMKNKKNTTVGEVSILNKNIQTEAKSIPLTHIFVTGHCPGLVQ